MLAIFEYRSQRKGPWEKWNPMASNKYVLSLPEIILVHSIFMQSDPIRTKFFGSFGQMQGCLVQEAPVSF